MTHSMSHRPVERRTLWKLRHGRRRRVSDWVVVEEPLEIRVGGKSLAVIMRTPGHDVELAAGFCVTEGVVRSTDDIGSIRQCGADGEMNVVEVALARGTSFDHKRLRRNLMSSAACGLCGKASLDAVRTQARSQKGFGQSGALHASGLFDSGGRMRVCREDVGRHNAVDKVVGRTLLDGRRTDDAILLVSGRTSFEILQKAAVAGIPIVCAISGPTTLAIETARAFKITLVNFLRGSGMNVASCPERIVGRGGRIV